MMGDVALYLLGFAAGLGLEFVAGPEACWLRCIKKRREAFLFNYDFWPAGFSDRACLKQNKCVNKCRHLDCVYLNKFKKVLVVVRSAKKSIDMCIALYTQKSVTNNLIMLQKEGVKVRLITDKALGKQGTDGSAVLQSLDEGGILVKKIATHKLMHHKFLIVDGKILLNGSMNWTNTGFFGNYENLEICNDEKAIAAFRKEFNHLWNLNQ